MESRDFIHILAVLAISSLPSNRVGWSGWAGVVLCWWVSSEERLGAVTSSSNDEDLNANKQHHGESQNTYLSLGLQLDYLPGSVENEKLKRHPMNRCHNQ